ncbi:hypothetical protein FHS43_000133 [Streptosporangium becharense]|uniref:DUF742 domain-containing protein n=1 Tax=Streptosporangium becharense TaxID=1816182 RepID=A0A7W9IG43_9ACTN|nr:DUF742 domain-containing protein [Streptosporangium becharense]MBB2908887.1 hypothetical protein [Streptosporangium becharense]MBB5820095.1 hypothetical protein [Streptosporangium becharense]
MSDVEWVDEDAGPVVRPYAVTGGRTRTASARFDLLAMAVATGTPISAGTHLGSQHRRLLNLVRRARPIAEIASDAGLPVGVIRVLLGDLLDHGLILVRSPIPAASAPPENLLRELISGLRAL